jgi:hypothetical protein
LHYEVGAPESTCRDIEQSTKDVARDAERDVGEHAVRIGRERHVQRVRSQDRDVAGGFEPPCQDRDELGIEFDCQHLSCSLCERVREHSTPGAELDDPIVARDAGVGKEL